MIGLNNVTASRVSAAVRRTFGLAIATTALAGGGVAAESLPAQTTRAAAAEATAAPSTADFGARYHDFILAAGNAESDTVRLAHLKKLAQQCSLDGVALPGLDPLIAFVERWVSAESK